MKKPVPEGPGETMASPQPTGIWLVCASLNPLYADPRNHQHVRSMSPILISCPAPFPDCGRDFGAPGSVGPGDRVEAEISRL